MGVFCRPGSFTSRARVRGKVKGTKQGGIPINEKTVKAIEQVLERGDRVEVIPTKDGLRVIRIRRETVAQETKEVKPQSDGG